MHKHLRRLLRHKRRRSSAAKTIDDDTTPDCAPAPVPELKLLELPIDLRANPFSKSTFHATKYDSSHSERLSTGSQGDGGSSGTISSFRFLDLPTELRLKVLAHHFGDRIVTATFDGGTADNTAKRRRWYASNCVVREAHTTAIIRTCKALKREAEDMLWDSTTFIVNVKPKIGANVSDVLVARSISRRLSLSKMRHAIFCVEIEESRMVDGSREVVWVWDKEHGLPAIDLLMEQLALGRGLKTAELHIDIGLSNPEVADAILTNFLDAKVDKMSTISCVQLQALSDDGKCGVVPLNDLASFRALLEKYKAIDASERKCGHTLPSLTYGQVGEVDTSIVNNW